MMNNANFLYSYIVCFYQSLVRQKLLSNVSCTVCLVWGWLILNYIIRSSFCCKTLTRSATFLLFYCSCFLTLACISLALIEQNYSPSL